MPHVTLRSPAELLAAVPYFFGFHPTNSLVLLAFHGKHVTFQARIDIPPGEEVDLAGEHLAEITSRNDPGAVVLIAYGTEFGVVPLVEAVGTELSLRKIPVLTILRVHEGRYYEMLCDDPECGLADGLPLDHAGTEFAATATLAGLVAHPDRDALVATVAPAPGVGIEPEISTALGRLEALSGGPRRLKSATRSAVRQAFERYMTGGRLDDDEIAWLAVLLADNTARDDTWARLASVPSVTEHEEVWRDMVRRVPVRYIPAPATLLALVAWRTGNGALATIALERALEADPACRLANLLQHALRQGLPPSALETMPTPRRRRRRTPRLSEAA
jgi:hypothetical protein